MALVTHKYRQVIYCNISI